MTAETQPESTASPRGPKKLAAELRSRVDQAIGAHLPTRDLPLEPAIQAERKTLRSHGGRTISYYEDRHGHGKLRPLVLVHSINASASAYEMRPLFEHYRGSRSVYAIDLAGFGFSERGPLPYTPATYAEELVALLTRVKDKDGEAPDVVALSLSCEFAARAAFARKDLMHTLAFLSPTGLDLKPKGLAPTASVKLRQTLKTPHWWGRILFEAVASKPSINFFLRKLFVGPVDPGLREYDYATAHQPGAEFAPLTFLSGSLFTTDIWSTYATLERPVLALYDRDPFVSFERLDELVERSPQWSSKRIVPTRGMPQFEKLEATTTALDEFWTTHAHHHRAS